MPRKPTINDPEFDADPDEPREAHLKILDMIRRIPPGYVSTYGRVAEAAGYPKRARWVGQILRNSPLADGVPWHRVVNAAGRISTRGGSGPRRQGVLLKAEGVRIDGNGRVDLDEYLWRFRMKRQARHPSAESGRRSVVLRAP